MEELGNKKLTSYVKDAGKRDRKIRKNAVEVNMVRGPGSLLKKFKNYL
jgi:hypothetical protein